MRGILIVTCTGVSFAHGTNDGQKSIGLIMLTIIGLFPAMFSLNPTAGDTIRDLPHLALSAASLIERYGDDQKQVALDAARKLQNHDEKEHVGLRGDVYQLLSQLKHASEAEDIEEGDKKQAKDLGKQLGRSVEYAPWWVRILSALCLGIGTMVGYKRIDKTLGERLGNVHLTPAQGASAELVSAALIGLSGFTGMPVSTTHIVTSGIGGTMVGSGAGLRYGMLTRIVIAWAVTLPVTILLAGGLYYLLESPSW